jgi:signal transduction histidine kinase
MTLQSFSSLRLRLLAFAALASGLALALSWVGLSLLFERHAERQVRSELERYGQRLAAAVRTDQSGRPVLAATPLEPRFMQPASGLYWQVATASGEVRSRSLWDGRWHQSPDADMARWRTDLTKGPFEPRIIRIARLIRPQASGPAVLVEVAITQATVKNARDGFASELAPFLALLWASLMGASLVQVVMGLRPLAKVRAELAALQADPNARFDAAAHPSEIAPLADAINDLANARAQDMETARHRARDLAHALKTPIAALKLQAASLAEPAGSEIAQTVQVLNAAVQAELARSGAVGAERGTCLLKPVLERLLAVFARTGNIPDQQNSDTMVTLSVGDTLSIPLSEPVAFETLGALLDNALRHASRRVEVLGSVAADGRIQVCVSDDGPGLAPALRDAALTRGVRLDEARGTQGLGLAIARSYVEGSGGEFVLDDARAGGLAVKMTWPSRKAGAGP